MQIYITMLHIDLYPHGFKSIGSLNLQDRLAGWEPREEFHAEFKSKGRLEVEFPFPQGRPIFFLFH